MLGTLSLFVILIAGCGVSPVAIKAIDRGIVANKGHMNDAGLPQQARDIGQDNYDLLNQVKFNIKGTPVPADTAERAAARKKAKEEAAAAAGGDGQ